MTARARLGPERTGGEEERLTGETEDKGDMGEWKSRGIGARE